MIFFPLLPSFKKINKRRKLSLEILRGINPPRECVQNLISTKFNIQFSYVYCFYPVISVRHVTRIKNSSTLAEQNHLPVHGL